MYEISRKSAPPLALPVTANQPSPPLSVSPFVPRYGVAAGPPVLAVAPKSGEIGQAATPLAPTSVRVPVVVASEALKPTAGAGKQTFYTVKAGDKGFWGVANTVYGQGKWWYLIAKANPTANSNGLIPGQKLNIPPPPPTARLKANSTVARSLKIEGEKISVQAGSSRYRIVKGDGLWAIAQNHYGDGSLYPAILKVNRSLMADRLTPGQEILLPSKAQAEALAKRESSIATTASTGVKTGFVPGKPYFE
ncbi:MAG: LysM peptidoglycan-binding domain-containing protein [Planctomycetes bacterium]|nr:LysM peptidoglycan-binding domain-containing protein [Planctomycetota bacterium]